jgi:phi13 family phage major tail protein
MAMRIGCDHLVYAIMTTEDTAEAAPVYGIVTAAPGVMSININPNASLATAFYDDGPGESASTLGNIEVEIQKNTLTTQNKADLLGHTIDDNGGIAYADDDVPPFVAIGFRTLKSNGKYRYVWLYKGRFADPEDNNETKADSINFQSDTINGQFVKLQHPVVIGGKSKRLWKYEIDADNAEADSTTMESWFDDVTFPAVTPEVPEG